MRLGDFSALTFDCYGTLIDWETDILAALRPWTTAHGVEVDDEELLAAFGRAESRREAADPTAPLPADPCRRPGRPRRRARHHRKPRGGGGVR
jgi:2-haloacid dehalogenase